MKKITKKLGAIVLALAMCFSLFATALAASEYTITIENSVISNTYSAYKIFDVTYSGDAVSYTISSSSPWLNQINASSSPFTLSPEYSDTYTGDYTVTTGAAVSEEDIVDFLNSLTVPTSATASATGVGNGSSITLDVGEPGYYYVTTSNEGAVVTITTAAPSATVIDKNTTPGSLDKVIKVDDGNVHEDVEAVDDDVEFLISAYAPLFDGDKIVLDYEFDDTMGGGLEIELNGSQVNYDSDKEVYYLDSTLVDNWVTIQYTDETTGQTVTKSISEVATNVKVELINCTSTDDGGYIANGFKLTYDTISSWTYDDDNNITGYTTNYPANGTIYIDYTAHMTEDAEYDNQNEVTMYWHVTSYKDPTPEEPGNPEGGLTKKDDVYVLTLDVSKVDGTDDSIVLSGAEFTLEGTNLREVIVSTTYTYTPVDDPQEGETYWYLLTNGNYTDINPATLNDPSEYVQNSDGSYTAYTRTEQTDYAEGSGTSSTTISGVTGSDGQLTFEGILLGDYTLTEVVAPDGYNLLESPIHFTVSVKYDETTGVPTWTITNTDTGDTYDVNTTTGAFTITVDNNAGTELPGTGGMGTTIFYIIGGVLVAGAVVVLVTRRRVNREA